MNRTPEEYKRIRNDIIKQMTDLVNNKPDKYDINNLQKAIDAMNNVPDKNLDAWILLQKEIDILSKPIYNLNSTDIDKFKSLMTKYGYKLVEEKLVTDSTSEDYASKWIKNDITDVIWFNRCRPMFSDYKSGEYNLLGFNMQFPMNNFYSFDELLNNIETYLR